ncbi:UNVERIFIED_CONTAM: hypothetical protein FKN15_063852 [Acipenser sinensis]
MAVKAVHLESDAFLVCMNHALSTEKEEVMGLCIGEVDTDRIVHIHSVIILRRSDKRKDHVRTQAMYQMMDQGFVGLIFSCFIEDKNTKTGRVLYTCFQSVQAQKGSDLAHLDPITKIHNGSVFTKNLCSQMSAISGPLLQWLEDKVEQNKQNIAELQLEKERLTLELTDLD